MAHLHKKMKNGRPYYYVREIARVDGKPKVINQVYLGSPEKILQMATEKPGMPAKLQVQEFGALWLVDLIDREFGIAELIDLEVGKGDKETGASVGEYFFYAIANRMISARSKRALADWYKSTAIQQIRPTDLGNLTSQRFWRKWDRVEEKQLKRIAAAFFRKLAQLVPPSDCFMFDTTNYYTFMASDTDSELAKRGRNKEGRDWLRQVGVALLVSRNNRLPLFYREYEGNRHDSKVFHRIIHELFGAMSDSAGEQSAMTLVFDKGMNSEDNIAVIDAHPRMHFITTYSTYYAEDLVHIDLTKFQVVDTDKNRSLHKQGREDDQLKAFRTTGEHWGQLRTVVVTYNPLTATKQRYAFEKKLLRLQDELFEMRSKVNKQLPHWKSEEKVRARYEDICADLRLPADLYNVELYPKNNQLQMAFRKNHYRISRHIDRFGKNILITDNMEWSTDEIVRASLDRYMVENAFRQSKDDDLVSLMPVRHWTDSKIRCHIFSCIVALAYLRMIEIRLHGAGLKISAEKAMEEMHRLHSCLLWQSGKKNPERLLEEPSEMQAGILKVFGYEIKKGVLQGVSR
jgi:transposase